MTAMPVRADSGKLFQTDAAAAEKMPSPMAAECTQLACIASGAFPLP